MGDMLTWISEAVGVGAPGAATLPKPRVRRRHNMTRWWRRNLGRRFAFRRAGARFSPDASLAWVMGFLAIGACIAPWLAHGWLWFELIVMSVALPVCYDALALWRTRKEVRQFCCSPKKACADAKGRTFRFLLQSLLWDAARQVAKSA